MKKDKKENVDGQLFSRTDLLKALNAASSGIDVQGAVDQSQTFVFDNTRIYTFCRNIGVQVPFDSGIRCAVPSVPLLTLLRKLKKDDILLSYDKGQLSVRQGKGVAVKLTVFDDLLLPFDEHIHPPEKMRKLRCTPKAFAEGVAFVLFTVCDDTQELQLCGIHLGADAKGTYVETYDKARATRKYISEETKPIDLKIPLVAAKALVNLGPTMCGENEGWLYFKCEDDVQFACWTPDAEYPNLNPLQANVLSEKQVTVKFPESIEATIDLADTFSSNGSYKDAKVTVEITGKKARITAEGEYGSFKKVVTVESDGDVTFCVHPKVLMEALAMSLTLIITENYLTVDGKDFWHNSLLNMMDDEGTDNAEEDGNEEE